jgi:hypothetical protein
MAPDVRRAATAVSTGWAAGFMLPSIMAVSVRTSHGQGRPQALQERPPSSASATWRLVIANMLSFIAISETIGVPEEERHTAND